MSKSINDSAFKGQTGIHSVEFGSQCEFIGESAFEGCTSLVEINKDNKIKGIGSKAFAETRLNSATFTNLIELHSNVFDKCSELKSISIPNCISIKYKAFNECDNLLSINIDNCETIDDYAFNGCSNLGYISAPNCKKIGANAFYGCSYLKYISIDKCEEIGISAFKQCKFLNQVILSECKKISEYAFMDCENLKQITLSKCSMIGKDAFVNCNNLSRVYIKTSPDNICALEDSNVFCICNESNEDNQKQKYEINTNTYFYFFNSETIEKYKNDENWVRYKDYMIQMPESNQIMYISNDNKVIDIKNYPCIKNEYYSIYGLIDFENDVKTLHQMFRGSKKLISIDIPSNCEHIVDRAFEQCDNLKNVELSNIKKIDDFAFKDCISLTSFTIPDSIEILGDGIFSGCTNIEIFRGKFTSYDGKAVVYNDKLICISPIIEGEIEISEIDEKINRLGKYSFHKCENIKKVYIPSNIISISNNVFDGCKNLSEVHFSGYPPIIGNDVFKDVNDDFKIIVPKKIFNLYKRTWKDTEYYDFITI